MGILDYPLGAGSAAEGERLIETITSALRTGPQPVAFVITQDADEGSWLVNKVAQREKIAFDLVCVLNRADPFTSVRKLLDFENPGGVYGLQQGTLLLIEGFQSLEINHQMDLLSVLIQVCRSRMSRALVTCEYERSAVRESSDDIRVVASPAFPTDPDQRKAIVQELLKIALSRERVQMNARSIDHAVQEISMLSLPKGFWQTDRGICLPAT